MIIDVILILITLAVAVIGTLTDLKSNGRAILILLAVGASVFSIYKSYKKNKENNFLQWALTVSLAPSPKEYDHLKDDVLKAAPGYTIDDYHHFNAGVVFFLDKTADHSKSILIFDREEIAQIYANLANREDNKSLIQSRLNYVYKSDDKEREDILNRICILGSVMFRKVVDRFPNDCTYGNEGVNYFIAAEGRELKLNLAPNEIGSFTGAPAAQLFSAVADHLHGDIRKLLPGVP